MRWEDDNAEIDPDEFCVNCGAKIQSIYRTCGFCGKVWWKHEESMPKNRGRGSDNEALQRAEYHAETTFKKSGIS